MISVSIHIVTYFPDYQELGKVISHVVAAASQARKAPGSDLGEVSLTVFDNSCNSDVYESIDACLKNHRDDFSCSMSAIKSIANIGFGAGHNSAIKQAESTYHLILNPDAVMERDALTRAIRFMEENPSVGMLVPRVSSPDGKPSYLCKRYPSVFDLLLRGFAPRGVQQRFRRRLEHYEMRDVTRSETVLNIPIASGCFMFFRTEVLKRVGGFDERYFLYFEDFDLSMRMQNVAPIAYVPSVYITHGGGNAARKGHRHIAMFVKSAFRFFSHWGWKWR